MYQSPIDFICKPIRTKIDTESDQHVFKAVLDVGVHVDKEELIKALKYDRDQYEKGYADGLLHRADEWISVDERLPDIDPYGKGRYGGARSVRVLCACKQRSGRTFTKEGYYEPCGNGKVFWRIPGSVDSVTHWMPLPAPPQMKGGE